jgi:hypothetical protein
MRLHKSRRENFACGGSEVRVNLIGEGEWQCQQCPSVIIEKGCLLCGSFTKDLVISTSLYDVTTRSVEVQLTVTQIETLPRLSPQIIIVKLPSREKQNDI